MPSVSILAEPPVAVVDRNVDKHKTRAVAEAYLKYLYTPEAQEIIARNYYRPRNPQVAAKYKSRFPNVRLFTIDRSFGGWDKAQANHFNDGALFDQIFEQAKR
jgi:sulfate transport system substrate-binding protein